jgi:hypothetical protein
MFDFISSLRRGGGKINKAIPPNRQGFCPTSGSMDFQAIWINEIRVYIGVYMEKLWKLNTDYIPKKDEGSCKRFKGRDIRDSGLDR